MAGGWKPVALMVGLSVLASAVVVGAVFYRYHGHSLPGGFATLALDPDRDGASDYLLLRTAVSLPYSGNYRVTADLLDGDRTVSQTTGTVELSKGPNIVNVGFLGGDVRSANPRGDLQARVAFSSLGDSGYTTVNRHTIPAVNPASFEVRESAVELDGRPAATPVDADGNGRFDRIDLAVPIRVNRGAYYQFRGDVEGGVQPVTQGRIRGEVFDDLYFEPRYLSEGAYTLRKSVDGATVYTSGVRGGVPIHVEVFTTTSGHYCPGYPETFATQPPENGGALGLAAPYVLPSRPILLSDMTTVPLSYDFDDFEAPTLPADFTGTVSDRLYDIDGDGLAEGIQVTAGVTVSQPGQFDISGTLFARSGAPLSAVSGTRSTVYVGGQVVSTAWDRVQLEWGTRSVSLVFPAAEILASGIPGPYEAKLRLVPANVVIDPVIVHVTVDYRLDQFTSWGAKAVSVESLSADLTGGTIDVGLSGSAQLLVRVIHENGMVVYESSQAQGVWTSGSSSYRFLAPTAGEYAVAAYLLLNGAPVDYREVVVTV